MPFFGNWDDGGSSTISVENRITGAVYTLSVNAIADSITVKLNNAIVAKNAKCAIYTANGATLKGETVEVLVPTGKDWRTFAFSEPKPELSAGDYLLVVWGDPGDGSFSVADYIRLIPVTSIFQSQAYDGWPASVTPAGGAYERCTIYCTYHVPIAPPTVTTQAATNIGDTGADGNGNITDDGGENPGERGFVWDLASHGDPGNVAPGASGYANNPHEHDGFGAGAFSLPMPGLPAGDVIYYRAYAHNSEGYDYGAEQNFLTVLPRDLFGEFIVRPSGSRGLGAGFIVRQAGSQDLAASFGAQVSLNLAAEFIVRHSNSENLPGEFISRQSASQDLAAELIVRPSSSTDLLGIFTIQGAGSEDLLGTFDIRRDASEELLGIFSARHASSEDLLGEFIVRQAGSQDLAASFGAQVSLSLLGKFAVRQPSSEDLAAEFIVRHSNSENLPGEFIVRRDGLQELAAELIVRQVGAQNLPGEFEVRRSASQELLGELVIRHPDFEDLAAELIVRQVESADLLGELVVRQAGSQNLLAGLAARRSSSVELAAAFNVDDTHSITGITKDNAGNRLGNCEVALFRTEPGVPPIYTFIASGVSDALGDYTFTGLTLRRFFVRAQKDGVPNTFDTTDNELEPV